ncbi:ribosome biogenesis [Favolaschia claudopus]|uniref:Ribosome biogenesis n=1 Tax=Favolaschia claudopus TaxID=2862362 RepID=A0AAW0BFH1_9AGAR
MASTLGKRKERDDESHRSSSTLFVSNLPYTATSVDLQTLFSDIAPVRSAFVVTEHGTGLSKGVGYVSFALKEDAQSAFDTITKDGINLVGRSLRVQWADSKPKEPGDRVKTEAKPRPQPRLHAPADPLAIRTVIVSGLPSQIDAKILWKKFRKYAGAEKVDWPAKNDQEDDDPATAQVLFTSPSDAQAAVGKLHAHIFKGSLLSVTLKKRLDTLAKPVAKPGKAKASATPSHASRLIVRNIPFTATEQDLRAVFLPYGPIYSIHIPPADAKGKKPETEAPAPPRTKGYAFVWMLSKKDAERAIEGCNGMTVRAGLAEGMVSDKQKKKKQRRVEKKMKLEEAGAAAEDEDEEDAEDDKRAVERVIAVDWALSKDKWKEEKAKMELEEGGDVEMTGSSDSESESGSSSSDDSSEDGDESDSALGVHDGEDSETTDEEDDDGDSQTPLKPQLPPPEEGTTLFVRNVPFSATDEDLRTLFRAFGPLRYTRVTLDPSTGRSRGTGFACYWNKEDADKVVEQSELLRSETTGSEVTQPKKNPFSFPSILTPDPSSTLARSLVLHGRTLDVVRAVTRDVAGKLKEDGEKRREKADKRNMYLLREGVILPNTPAADTLTSTDIERRTASYNARRTLLKSNPALFISRTRLSFRQIPLHVTERQLKHLAIYAVRAFQDDVKTGARAALTPDELAEVPEEEEGKEDAKQPKQKMSKKKLLSRRTGVKQAKIVRQGERVDPVTGKGRSKGYGFVEMHKHADALRVLRWANNNSDVGPLFETWWKEELQDLIKAETGKIDGDRDDARLTRLKDELERGNIKKAKGTLIVEFSIENITTIQRRNTVQKERTSDKPSRRPPVDQAKAEERPAKKARLSPKKPVADDAKDKPKTAGQTVGPLIGRKRKERKAGKKSK